MINVSWYQAQDYAQWLSSETGEEYRLLSESEWEYVARAWTTTQYHTGWWPSSGEANYGGLRNQTLPVGSFAPNAFGLYDVHGNVYEWTQDCWNDNYRGAPTDGSAWERDECRRVVRGGSWIHDQGDLRSAHRDHLAPWFYLHYVGFRVARTLTQ